MPYAAIAFEYLNSLVDAIDFECDFIVTGATVSLTHMCHGLSPSIALKDRTETPDTAQDKLSTEASCR